MKVQVQARLFSFLLVLLFQVGVAMAQRPTPSNTGALTLPVSGTVVNAAGQAIGQFGGMATINRFGRQDNQIVAVTVIRGTIVDLAGHAIKSGLQTVVLPVTNIGNQSVASLTAPASTAPQIMPISLTVPRTAKTPAQTQGSCGVLHLDIGGNAVNLLGVTVNLTPITLDLAGDSSAPLGNLVCQVLDLLNTAGNVVGLLNQILGLVTGLVGGLTGGLG